MILAVTRLDGKTALLVMENVCSITPPLLTDQSNTGAVFRMNNGDRLEVADSFMDIENVLRNDVVRV